jgi:2-methylfumaryl-CoA hydratase
MRLKNKLGGFFGDFFLGQEFIHATPRTLTEGDASLYTALYGSQFAVNSSDTQAMNVNFEAAPIDDILIFHMTFCKTIPEVSLNATANLGYSNCIFGVPVYPGDTLFVRSHVIGLNESTDGKAGTVYVQSQSRNQNGDMVLDYVHWVLIPKNTTSSEAPKVNIPQLLPCVDPEHFILQPELNFENYETELSGSTYLFDDYVVGEKIDHIGCMTIERVEQMMAARLYQNSSHVHVNKQHVSHGRRLVYEGHIISQARALSFNGLANALKIIAINKRVDCNPTLTGDTISAWSEVLSTYAFPNKLDMGALRLRTVAIKNKGSSDFPYKDDDGKYNTNTILDFDYWVLMPRNMQ